MRGRSLLPCCLVRSKQQSTSTLALHNTQAAVLFEEPTVLAYFGLMSPWASRRHWLLLLPCCMEEVGSQLSAGMGSQAQWSFQESLDN